MGAAGHSPWHRPGGTARLCPHRASQASRPHTEVGQALPWVRQCQRPCWVPGLRMEHGLAHLHGAAPRDPGSVVPHGHLSAARQGLSWGRSWGQRRGPTGSQSPALPCARGLRGPAVPSAHVQLTSTRLHGHTHMLGYPCSHTPAQAHICMYVPTCTRSCTFTQIHKHTRTHF